MQDIAICVKPQCKLSYSSGYDSYDEEEKEKELARIKRERGKSCRPQKAVSENARKFSRRVKVVAVKPLINVNPDDIEDEEERQKAIEMQVKNMCKYFMKILLKS